MVIMAVISINPVFRECKYSNSLKLSKKNLLLVDLVGYWLLGLIK
jgi:hypothetical protein